MFFEPYKMNYTNQYFSGATAHLGPRPPLCSGF